MTTILCYGDSNTYGYDPRDGMKYPADSRWPGILKKLLGPSFHVVEEGCNGRTTVFTDPAEEWKNGLTYLKPCLNSHKPIDILIIMLGSNDLKKNYHASAADIADGAGELVRVAKEFLAVKQGFVPEIILVSPPLIGEGITESPFSESFDATAIERSKQFSDEYRRVAEVTGCIYFDAAPVAIASDIDSLHLSPESHKALAIALCKTVLNVSKQKAHHSDGL